MTKFLRRSALAVTALTAVTACASPDEYEPTAASYPAGTLVTGPLATAPGATVTYPSGTTVYYPPTTAALPRAATDPSAFDATRRNSQSVGGGMVRMGTSLPMESGN